MATQYVDLNERCEDRKQRFLVAVNMPDVISVGVSDVVVDFYARIHENGMLVIETTVRGAGGKKLADFHHIVRPKDVGLRVRK